jgi:hypothetical protein
MLANDRNARTFRVPIRLVSQLALAMCLAAWPLVAQAGVIFVKPTGNDTHSGLSWGTAKQTVTAGLSAATGGDQVWVAAGTYVERVTLKTDVALYGGFAGDEDPATFDLGDRDFGTNETILDGNQAGAVVTGPSGATHTCRIDGFTITRGKTPTGGGLYLSSSSPTIANNTITGNTASADGRGGGLFLAASSPIITNNTITSNTSGAFGGALYAYNDSSPTIVNNTITANYASQSGGGLYLYGGSPLIANNRITGNTAHAVYGGGLAVTHNSYATITSNTIAGNNAPDGGGLALASSSPTIANNTIVGNSADHGGALYLAYGSSSPIIANTIVSFNSSGFHQSGSGTPTLRYNCVYDNAGYDYSGLNDPTGTDGNISVDPLFIDQGAGDYHTQPSSPGLDAGNNPDADGSYDLDGYPRIIDGNHDGTATVDIGAYEYHAYLHGDLNCDGLVNTFDIDPFVLALIDPAGYALAYPNCDIRSADCDSDSTVNVFDIDPFVKLLIGG